LDSINRLLKEKLLLIISFIFRTLHNETTTKLDLFIQNLAEGSSYLTAVTPMNKKGVGQTTHVIVDTLRHPAVELTQAEGATGDEGSLASSSDRGERCYSHETFNP